MHKPLFWKTIFVTLFLVTAFYFSCAASELSLAEQNYPLGEGNYWVYMEHVSIKDKNGKPKEIDFICKAEIVSCITKGNFKAVKIKKNTLRGEMSTFYYIITGDKIYTIDEIFLSKIVKKSVEEILNEKDIAEHCLLKYIFPMKKDLEWKASRIVYKFDYVEEIGSITVPAGRFDNCFKLKYPRASSELVEWFFSGIGVVKYKSHFVDYDSATYDHTGELKEYHIK